MGLMLEKLSGEYWAFRSLSDAMIHLLYLDDINVGNKVEISASMSRLSFTVQLPSSAGFRIEIGKKNRRNILTPKPRANGTERVGIHVMKFDLSGTVPLLLPSIKIPGNMDYV